MGFGVMVNEPRLANINFIANEIVPLFSISTLIIVTFAVHEMNVNDNEHFSFFGFIIPNLFLF